jgi:hypothetical protein
MNTIIAHTHECLMKSQNSMKVQEKIMRVVYYPFLSSWLAIYCPSNFGSFTQLSLSHPQQYTYEPPFFYLFISLSLFFLFFLLFLPHVLLFTALLNAYVYDFDAHFSFYFTNHFLHLPRISFCITKSS